MAVVTLKLGEGESAHVKSEYWLGSLLVSLCWLVAHGLRSLLLVEISGWPLVAMHERDGVGEGNTNGVPMRKKEEKCKATAAIFDAGQWS